MAENAPNPIEAKVIEGEPIQPIKPVEGLDEGIVALGGRLFHDARLSGDGTVSCASCHDIEAGGDDGLPKSVGIGGKRVDLNAPTVLNSHVNFVQFWNGRVDTLEAQALGPLTAEKEMGSSWEHARAVIVDDPGYARDFEKLFEDGVTQDNFTAAIATFERSLSTPNGRFDAWLVGDKDALTEEEREGYALFKSIGCVACHQGSGVGGNMFQRFGVIGNYLEDRGEPLTEADLGRFALTGKAEDRFVFKVPSLRNVARTAPYLHDGSAKTLEEAVRIMGRYQLGRPVSAGETAKIVAFLKTLDGEIPDVSRFKPKSGAGIGTSTNGAVAGREVTP